MWHLWAMKKSTVEGHRKALQIEHNPIALWWACWEGQAAKCSECVSVLLRVVQRVSLRSRLRSWPIYKCTSAHLTPPHAQPTAHQLQFQILTRSVLAKSKSGLCHLFFKTHYRGFQKELPAAIVSLNSKILDRNQAFSRFDVRLKHKKLHYNLYYLSRHTFNYNIFPFCLDKVCGISQRLVLKIDYCLEHLVVHCSVRSNLDFRLGNS